MPDRHVETYKTPFRRLRRAGRMACALGLAASTTACSLFANSRQTITLLSSPEGAEAKVNGVYAGTTPVQVYEIDRKRRAVVTFSLDGYETSTLSTSGGLSTVGIIDVIGGVLWLVPLLGLLSGGAWEQTPDTLSATLRQPKGAALPAPAPVAVIPVPTPAADPQAVYTALRGIWSGKARMTNGEEIDFFVQFNGGDAAPATADVYFKFPGNDAYGRQLGDVTVNAAQSSFRVASRFKVTESGKNNEMYDLKGSVSGAQLTAQWLQQGGGIVANVVLNKTGLTDVSILLD